MLTTSPLMGQRHFNTTKANARLTMVFKDTVFVTMDNLEIILDTKDSLMWIGVHPAAINIDNKRDQKALKKQKAFIIKSTFKIDVSDSVGSINRFTLYGPIIGDLKEDSYFGSGFLKYSAKDSLQQLKMTLKVNKELFGKRISRKINGSVIPIYVPETILYFIDLKK